MKIDRRTLLFAGAGAIGAMASGRAWADAPVAVRGVLVEPSGISARVTLALDAPASPRTFFLREPDRFVIDLPNGFADFRSANSALLCEQLVGDHAPSMSGLEMFSR